MNKKRNKVMSLFVAVLLIFSQMNVFNAQTNSSNTENRGIVYGNPTTCIVGTSTIEDCFTDLVWAHAVAKKVGAAKLGTWTPSGFVTAIPEYDVSLILTDALIAKITVIDGVNDVQPFIYKDAAGISYMPKMDGFSLFTELKNIRNFKYGTSYGFANTNWTDAGVTDFSKWGEAPNIESIVDIKFMSSSLTSIDLGLWGNLSQLKLLQNIDFGRNKLTNIGDLGAWGNATNLETISYVIFQNNLLTDVGQLSEWKNMAKLKKIESLILQNNQLTDIGDLGEWEVLPEIEIINKLWFGSNKLTYIGDLGKWKSLTTLTTLESLSFHTNNLTDIGDLGEWSNLTNLKQFSHIGFGYNKLTDIGDISRWSSLTNISRLEYINFERNLLTNIGDLSEWSNLTNLTSFSNINFYYNRLTSIGDIGAWSNLNKLTSISYINFGLNRLTDIGDLSEWNQITNLQRINSIVFDSNQLTDIGDISKWSSLTNLTSLSGISFRNNYINNIGDLGKWSNLTNLTSFGSIDFSLNNLTNIGDIGEWSKLTKLTELKYIEFRGNKLTEIGDLGRWAEIPNMQDISYLDFANNQLTSIGDLGKWGNHTKLMRIWQFDFSNNKLTDIGDLGAWGDLSTLLTLRTLNFSANQLTDIGDIGQWQNIPNVATFVREMNFSNNKIETIALTDSFAAQTFPVYSSLFNFTLQKYQRDGYYINRHGLANGANYNVTVPAHNPYNHPSGDYGAYTLTPDVRETYKDSQNNTLTVSDAELTVPVKVKDANAIYVVSQKNHIPVEYTATINHPLYWIDLSIDAADFDIELSDIAANLVNDTDAINSANTEVQFIDENNQTQTVIATINQTEYQAIKNTTTTGVFPLTFSYTYQNITIDKTIQVTVKDTPPLPDVLSIDASDFSVDIADVDYLTDASVIASALVDAENITQGTNITNKVTVDVIELYMIQTTMAPGVFPLTFYVTDNGQTVSKTIDVTVYPTPIPDTLHIDASDFMINLNDVSSLTEELAMTNAQVAAENITQNTDITSQAIVDPIELATIQNATIPGDYILSFSVTDNGVTVSHAITVTVYVDILSINATDFTIELSDVMQLTETLAKTNASVQAENTTQNIDITNKVTVDATELTTIQNTTITGVYPLTFIVIDNGQTVTTTINVTVINTPILDVLLINATDFTMELSDVSLLTETLAKTNAFVQAENVTQNTDITNKVTVNAVELATIQSATTIGVYPLTFEVTDNGQTITTTIDVTVINTPIPDVLAITATDFSIELSDVSSLTEELAMTNASVQAKNITQNSDITNKVISNPTELTAIQTTMTIGTYPLTFTVTDNGQTVSTTINVFVIDTLVVIDELKITATDFSMNLSDVPTLTDTLAKTLANVSATNITQNTNITDKSSANAVELATIQMTKTPGVYPLTFNVTDNSQETSTTILVTVIDNQVPDELMITAIDFNIKLADVKNLTGILAKTNAAVQAKNITQNKDITDKVMENTTDLTAIQETTIIGVYPLTFTVTDNGQTVSTTINVVVYDDVSYDYSIIAHDATLEITEYWNQKNAGTLDQYIIDITGAKAFNETLQIEVSPILADLTNFETAKIANGTKVNVTFSYIVANQKSNLNNQDVSTTVIITLYEETSTPIPSEENRKDTLVQTGVHTQEILIVGSILTTLSIVFLCFSKKLRNRKKPE